MMASHSILASALPIAALPSPSQATSRLHKLTGHSLGHRAPVQGDQIDYIIPVLPTGVHLKQLGGKNRVALHRWTWLLLSFCQKNWAKSSVSTIWRAGCSLECPSYSLQLIAHHRQLFTSSSTSLLMLLENISPHPHMASSVVTHTEKMPCSEGCL